MRLVLFIVTIIIAYVLLRGYPESLPQWLRAALALIVIMIAVPLRDSQPQRKKIPLLKSVRSPKWLDFLYIGAVIFCIEIFLLASFTLGPKTAEDTHEEISAWLTDEPTTHEVAHLAPGNLNHNKPGNWLWDNHFRRTHPKQIENRPPNKPEIYMTVNNKKSLAALRKQSIYLRTFALARFDGETWSMHQPTKHILEKPQNGNIQISPVNGTWKSTLPVIQHTISQANHTNGQNLLTTLHNTIDTDLQNLTRVSSDTYVLPPLLQNAFSYSYAATSQPILLDQITLFDKNLEVSETHTDYLSRVSHPRLQRMLTEYVSFIDKKSPLLEQLEALQKRIQDQISYSLTIENKGNINAIENFLFEEKSGYCEFYASATAMLCRELGIPSRIAFGWSGGKFYPVLNLYVFRTKDAHAWTEIYLKDYGWVVFDTTPASAITETESELGEAPPVLAETTDHAEDAPLDEQPDDTSITWKNVLITLAVLISMIIGILLFRRYTLPTQLTSRAVYLTHEPKYLKLFQKCAASLGHPLKPGQTLMQSIQLLKMKQLNIPGFDQVMDEILIYHYDTVYRNAPADKGKENHITSELKRISKLLEK